MGFFIFKTYVPSVIPHWDNLILQLSLLAIIYRSSTVDNAKENVLLCPEVFNLCSGLDTFSSNIKLPVSLFRIINLNMC